MLDELVSSIPVIISTKEATDRIRSLAGSKKVQAVYRGINSPRYCKWDAQKLKWNDFAVEITEFDEQLTIPEFQRKAVSYHH